MVQKIMGSASAVSKIKTSGFILVLFVFCSLHGMVAAQVEPFSGSLREYYFPYKNFKKPHTLIFHNVADTSETIRWVLQTECTKKDTVLTVRVFDRENKPLEETTQQIRPDGVYLLKYTQWTYIDESTVNTYNCTVGKDAVYSFTGKADTIYWDISFNELNTGQMVKIIKERSLAGKLKISETLKFKDDYYLNAFGQTELDHQVSSYYTKGQGLTSYALITRDAITKYYILKNQNQFPEKP